MTPLDGMDEGRLHQNDTGVWTKDSQVRMMPADRESPGGLDRMGWDEPPLLMRCGLNFEQHESMLGRYFPINFPRLTKSPALQDPRPD